MLATDIIRAAAQTSHMTVEYLLGPKRNRRVMRVRFALYWAFRERGASFAQIGFWMNRDHSTVIYGQRRAQYVFDRDPAFRDLCLKLRDMGPKKVTQVEQKVLQTEVA